MSSMYLAHWGGGDNKKGKYGKWGKQLIADAHNNRQLPPENEVVGNV